jgi:hypothetical protein
LFLFGGGLRIIGQRATAGESNGQENGLSRRRKAA